MSEGDSKAWQASLAALDCYEMTTDGGLFPLGAWVWVDWTDNEPRPGRVMVARVLDVLHLVTVDRCGEGWQMKNADGQTAQLGGAHLGACKEWRPKGRSL